MRKLFAPVLVGLSLLAGTAIAQEKIAITPDLVAAAEKEGELTLQYSAPLNAMQAMAAAFGKAYPKVRLNLERKAGSTGAQALLQEIAAGVHRIDVFQGTDAGANAELIKQQAFAALTPELVGDFPASATAMAPYIYYPDVIRTVVMYNPKFVTEAEAEKLRAWDGILDPAFKGRFSLVEPSFGVTLAPLLYVMNNPKLGEDFLRKLKAQDPVIFLNTAQARDSLMSGQKPISWGAQWENIVFSDFERGAPIRFVYPNPTVAYGGNGWGVLAKAPHPNAARLFFAWGMSRDGGLAIQGPQYNGRSALKSLEDTRTVVPRLKKEAWFKPAGEDWNPDIKDWIGNGPRYQEIWTRILKGR